MRNVLVVEDNEKVNGVLTKYISQEGHNVISCFSAEEGLVMFNSNNIDLIVTDLMLPGMSGEQFVEEIRKTSRVYIIILSAKVHLEDKLTGLKLGADDYILKPFSTDELILKVNNFLLRNEENVKKMSFYHSELLISKDNNTLFINDTPVELTTNEFKILLHLATNRKRIITRDQLLEHCFRDDIDIYDRTIDVYIKNIRKKLNDDSKNPRYIKTIYGLGYMFVGEIDV